jgi:amino acid adenylation domain-containing protein
VAVLAVLKAGGAYLPLDSGYPHERLTMMLDDSRAAVLLTDTGHTARISADVVATRLYLDGLLDGHAAGAAEACTVADVAPEQLAYVIYTSGSTGRPKGVLVEHRSLLNLCHWHNGQYGVTSADRATMIAALGFDASVWELWPYLVAGASVSIAGEAERADPDRLAGWMAEQDASIAFLPTPLAETLLDNGGAARLPLRALLTGGDVLRRRPDPDLPFAVFNHYGPTECTVVATAGAVDNAERASGAVPIGRPIDNIDVHLLDGRLEPVPRGVQGELCLGGVGVARGYLGRPDLTNERFVTDPFGPPGSRLYRTGDLARWRPDGTLEFLGRADRQVKIRGYRIEPGEIEVRLREHSAVAEAVVVPFRTPDGEDRLAGYVVAAPGAVVDPGEVRRWLRERLPEYMVPAVCVVVDGLPMTSSGKLDRARLPVPSVGAADHPAGDYVAPRDDLEATLVDLFGAVLGRDQVGIRDNFFDIGGHSLLAARLAARMRADFGMDVPVQTVFVHPTVESLATALAAAVSRS